MNTVCMLVQNSYDIDIRVRRKAEALVVAGYEVDVFALAASEQQPRNHTLNGVNVYTLQLGKQRGSLLRYIFEYFAFFFWSFWKVSVLMGRRRYKVVDVNTLPDFLIFAGVYAKLRGAKLVLDMHEITPEFYMSKYGLDESAFSIRLQKFLERISFSYADYVLTINEPISRLLQGRGLNLAKTTEIMNAVDDAMFATVLNAAQPPAPGKFVMMYHGTLTKIYGLDIAIEAFAKARQQMPEAEFWILGGGPEKPGLQALAKERGLGEQVKFIGNVLPQEIPLWLLKSTVGVLPTRRDVFLEFSFSNKLSEYITMGKSVIVARLKAIRHYFSEEAFAYFEPHDVDDLAKQMVRLYQDPVLRSSLAEHAKREYAPICWDVMKQRYIETIRRLASGPGLQTDKAATTSPATATR